MKTLRHDPDTGQLLLRYHDLWKGVHEVTEYRVMDIRTGGRPVRNRPDLDGTPVLGTAPDLYIKQGGYGGYITHIWAEEIPQPVQRTPCPRSGSARRKRCDLCAALEPAA